MLNTTEHAFNSVNNYTIQLSSTQDDYLYALYDSYVTFKIKTTVTGTGLDTDYNTLLATQQHSGIIKSASTNYQYINQNGEVMNVVLTDESSYCPAARNIINQLFLTKAEHDRNAEFTEFRYNTDDTPAIFNGFITCHSREINSATKYELTFSIKVPLGEVLQGVNTNSFINLKMLRADLTFVEPHEFFENGITANTINLYKFDSSGTSSFKEVDLSNTIITECNITLSTYTGDVSSVPAELRQLRNQQVKADIIKLNSGSDGLTQQITVPFKSSFLIMYFTDKTGRRDELEEPIIQQWRVGLTGVSDSYKTYFNPSADANDDYWYFLNNYCTNCGKEQNTLMTYEAWKYRMHYWILPLNELLPQQAQNLFNFSLKLKNTVSADGLLLNLIWVKAGEE